MKKTTLAVLLVLASGLLLTPAHAQWSHKAGDPEPHSPGLLVQPFTQAEWDASNFAPPESVEWFRDAKYGMFIHFGLSTHDNADLSWGTCHTRKAPDRGSGPIADEVWKAYPKDFKLEKFNAKEWVEIAKAGGFKYVVVIAKHHDGFHLWDTAQSDFKVTNTPFARDYLKELADACQEAGMPFGIYYSQRDWYHPDYNPTEPTGELHKKYNDYQFKAVRELLTKYGKVDIFWWDAAWWGGMFTAGMWDAEKLTRMARELQPGILLNNRASVPGDFDTPEQRLGFFQDWRPWESCICLTSSWSYSGGEPKSRDQLIQIIVANAACDGNLLLSWGPQWSGEFAPKEKDRLIEVGEWLKQNGRAIYGTRAGPWKWSSWGGSTRRGKTAWLHVVKGEKLEIPALSGVTVVSAQTLNGEKVDFQQNAKTLTVTVPKASPVSIIELTFDKPVNDFLAGAQVPGRKARFVRLETKPEKPEYFHLRQVQVYGKGLDGHSKKKDDTASSSKADANTAANPLRILCVGDSITAGYTDNPTWGVPFEFGYRQGLFDRLQKAGYHFQFVGDSPEPWDGRFGVPKNAPSPDLRPIGQDRHEGHGGWNTAQVLQHIDHWIAKSQPDIVLLMIGINDGGRPPAAENLKSIVEKIVAARPQAHVVVAQVTPRLEFTQSIADYNSTIRDTLVPEFQRRGGKVTTVDQYRNMLKPDGTIDPGLFSNKINHPNATAYDSMAQTWFEAIQAMFPLVKK